MNAFKKTLVAIAAVATLGATGLASTQASANGYGYGYSSYGGYGYGYSHPSYGYGYGYSRPSYGYGYGYSRPSATATATATAPGNGRFPGFLSRPGRGLVIGRRPRDVTNVSGPFVRAGSPLARKARRRHPPTRSVRPA